MTSIRESAELVGERIKTRLKPRRDGPSLALLELSSGLSAVKSIPSVIRDFLPLKA